MLLVNICLFYCFLMLVVHNPSCSLSCYTNSIFFEHLNIQCDELHIYFSRISEILQRGAVVEWLEQLGYGAESRRIA